MALPGGLTLPGIAAIAAILLAIIGLIGAVPLTLMSVAVVFLGICFVMSTRTGPRYSEIITDIDTEEMSSGTPFTPLAGIVLGILALIGIAPVTLTATAAIIFGGAMLLEGTAAGGSVEPTYASSGINLLCGTAAIVLGILSLSGFNPVGLTLVALLTVGSANLLTGTNLMQKTSSSISRRF